MQAYWNVILRSIFPCISLNINRVNTDFETFLKENNLDKKEIDFAKKMLLFNRFKTKVFHEEEVYLEKQF